MSCLVLFLYQYFLIMTEPCTYLWLLLQHRTCLATGVLRPPPRGAEPKHPVGVITHTNQERCQQNTVVKAMAFLSVKNCHRRIDRFWLDNTKYHFKTGLKCLFCFFCRLVILKNNGTHKQNPDIY